MLKSFSTILLSCCLKLAFCQTVADFNNGTFKLFLTHQPDAKYFASIVPDSSYIYWCCVSNPTVYVPVDKHQIVFETGDLKYASLTKKSLGGSGFMVGCPPAFCSYYIIAVRPDKTILKIDNSEKFKKFLGKIDNLDEVRLVLKDHGLIINNKSIKYGSYQERENDYLLYLNGIITDLGFESKTSTKAILTKTGDFKIIDQSEL